MSSENTSDTEPPEALLFPLIEEVRLTIEQDGEFSNALESMSRLLASSELRVPRWVCSYFVSVLSPSIPNVTQPIIAADVESSEFVLCRLFALARKYYDYELVLASGQLLYRYYESTSDFEEARTILREMLKIAEKERDDFVIGVLTNDLGYEYVLQCQYDKAEPFFFRARNLLSGLSNPSESDVSANLLICRFFLQEQFDDLLPELRVVGRALRGHWRARKTLMLQSRYAASRGRLGAAIRWARLAIEVADEIPTMERLDDLRHLHVLRNKQSMELQKKLVPTAIGAV